MQNQPPQPCPRPDRAAAGRPALRLLALSLSLAAIALRAAEPWESALDQMPLGGPVLQLNRTNCVELMLSAFRSNQVVKALIFMPGATDEFYMFRRARASLTQTSPSLLEAVRALTSQTRIRATFHPPFLLLHTAEDLLEPDVRLEDAATAEKLKHRHFTPHLVCNDRDWDYLQPLLRWPLKIDLRPWPPSTDSWHFYRHSFAAWGLNGWEILETAALAGKSRFTVRSGSVVFEPDPRFGVLPSL